MAASWPTAVATDANLYLAVNELQTNLSSGISNAVTTIAINSTTSFPTVGLILVDNEVIKYTGVSGSNLTGCTRGFDGTTAASHSAAAVVSFAIMAAHHNVLKDEIEAIEATLRDLVGLSPTLPLTVSLPVQTDSNGHLTASAITLSSSGVTGTLPVARGGTNSGTTLNNNRVIQSSGGAIVEAAAITASRALASDANGIPVASATTATELGFVSGVTSAIQTQIGTKAAIAGQQFTGNVSFDSASHGTVGTAGGGSPAAGNVGERIASDAGSVNAAGTNVFTDVTSITLTSGVWDISCIGTVERGAATVDPSNPFSVGISTTSGVTFTNAGSTHQNWQNVPTNSANYPSTGTVTGVRVSTAGATYYLKMRVTYSAGTPTFEGAIWAVRR